MEKSAELCRKTEVNKIASANQNTFTPHGYTISNTITTCIVGDSLPKKLLPWLAPYPYWIVSVMISPETFILKCRSLAKAKNPYLEVQNGKIRLAWETASNDGHIECMERADVIGLGLPYDMLLDAVFDAGGTLDDDGRYPLNDAIRQVLRKFRKCRFPSLP
jgi:hypothetical protein